MNLSAAGFDPTQLVVFTTLTPASAVAFAFLAVMAFLTPRQGRHRSERQSAGQQFQDVTSEELLADRMRLDHALFVPLALAWLGFIASATHLGTPANALYAFSGIGRSPLSNEVTAVVAFLFFGGIYWLMSFRRSHSRPIETVVTIMLIPCLVSVVCLLICTANAYHIDTIPTWDSWIASACYVAGALCSGSALAACMRLALLKNDSPSGLRRVALVQAHTATLVAAVALVAHIALLIAYAVQLSGISNNITSGAVWASSAYPPVICLVAALGALGMACLFRAERSLRAGKQLDTGRHKGAFSVAGAAAVLVAAGISRAAFYGAYLSLGF